MQYLIGTGTAGGAAVAGGLASAAFGAQDWQVFLATVLSATLGLALVEAARRRVNTWVETLLDTPTRAEIKSWIEDGVKRSTRSNDEVLKAVKAVSAGVEQIKEWFNDSENGVNVRLTAIEVRNDAEDRHRRSHSTGEHKRT